MSRPPSDATMLRHVKEELKRVRALLSERTDALNIVNAHINKLGVEVAEWKSRFDILLRKESKK